MYNQKYPYEIPMTEIVSIKTRIAVPTGEALFIGGRKVKTENEAGQVVEKHLLVLIKAETQGRS